MERAAYCGLFCGACPVFIANQSGRLKEFAKGGEFTPEELECRGCRSDKVAKFCASCSIRRCGKEKGHLNCLICPDYPCPDYVKFRDDPNYTYHLDAPGQMAEMRESGPQEWLLNQERKWVCPDCGGRMDWRFECFSCGKK